MACAAALTTKPGLSARDSESDYAQRNDCALFNDSVDYLDCRGFATCWSNLFQIRTTEHRIKKQPAIAIELAPPGKTELRASLSTYVVRSVPDRNARTSQQKAACNRDQTGATRPTNSTCNLVDLRQVDLRGPICPRKESTHVASKSSPQPKVHSRQNHDTGIVMGSETAADKDINEGPQRTWRSVWSQAEPALSAAI
jgi:hypothetical protein